jgi:hypothetical protein
MILAGGGCATFGLASQIVGEPKKILPVVLIHNDELRDTGH